MGIPLYNPINGDPGNAVAPRRPGLDDMGGATILNDLEFLPDEQTMISGQGDNIKQRLSVSYGKVVPVCVVTVHFSGGTPSVASFSAAGDNITTPTFTVTDNGTGDTTLAWPANTFPANVADHEAAVTGATIGQASAQTLTNSVRVRTAGATGTAADLPFNVRIY